ncbi:MAG: hypothetical protein EPN73_02190 [Paraburkholderia sp.]|uniref:iron-containing redox enzyme family protein n=1 Tax=Paraburkholderia sp. TaxID=1926495 RepID=UPI0012110401|nr:iron-containing redox enzyme family protein [Paraburkholderia sp.]TAL98744.1 MAG: hypothetical protein EPN73_02190 [Paraburkholderia sp.]
MNALTFLKQPCLRAEVSVEENDAGFALHLRSSTCQIEVNAAARLPLRHLFSSLVAGLEHAELDNAFGDFATEAREVIDQLDRFGYVTEGGSFAMPSDLVSSSVFMRLLRGIADENQEQATPAFTAQLRSGVATRAQLIRYAVEYYHIVRLGPGLVAPLLNWIAEPKLRADLSDFVGEEWRHDRLLAQSLAAVHLDPADIPQAAMLAPTFALIAQLGVRATLDPLALAALLYIYERPNPIFHELYAANCARVGLPANFVEPILRHASMNNVGRHEDMATLVVEHVCPVAPERAEGALADATVAIQHLQALDLALGRIGFI